MLMKLLKNSKVSTRFFLSLVNSTDFLRILNIPLAKDQMLILFQLQNSDIGNCEHFDETFP